MTKHEPITQHLVDSILYLYITDDDFLGAVRAIIPNDLFPSVLSARIASICESYYEQFNVAPASHFQDEFRRIIESLPDEDRDDAERYAKRLETLHAPNREYVMLRIHNFVRSRALERGTIEAARSLQRGDCDEAVAILSEVLQSGAPTLNIGLDFTRDEHPMARRNEILVPLTTTSWPQLDNMIGGGLYRGRFVVILGKFKGKKTWTLCNIACGAVRRGLNVVHITHEMPEVEIEVRYDRMFGSMVKETSSQDVPFRMFNPKTKEFENYIEHRPSVYDAGAVHTVRRHVARTGGRLIIKKYPMGTCTMRDVDAYLTHLEKFEGIVPDVLINDYADIMAHTDTRMSYRDQINATYIWHKRLADERGMLVVTASQATRAAIERPRFSMKDFAEDIRKVANCDLALGICQTPLEDEEEIGRAIVVASRSTKQTGLEVAFGMTLDAGQYVTWDMRMKDWNEIRSKLVADREEDYTQDVPDLSRGE